MTTARHWTPVDSRQVLPAADQALATRFTEALIVADRLALELPSLISVMRDHHAGQPKAANLGPRGSIAPWCWAHEQDTSQCDAAGLPCDGELLSGPSDPTGDAATRPDRAAADLRQVRRSVEALIGAVDRLHLLAANYPTQALTPDDAEAEVGEDWCRSCWSDGQRCVPVAVKSDGKRNYRGLCRWCGQTAAVLGGDPPSWLVKVRWTQRVNQGHIDKAKAEVAARKPKKGGKVKSKRAKVEA